MLRAELDGGEGEPITRTFELLSFDARAAKRGEAAAELLFTDDLVSRPEMMTRQAVVNCMAELGPHQALAEALACYDCASSMLPFTVFSSLAMRRHATEAR